MKRNTEWNHHACGRGGTGPQSRPEHACGFIMMPLGLLMSGEGAVIKEIRALKGRTPGDQGDHGYRNGESRLEDMGMRVGKSINMIANKGSGPLLIKIDESRIAISRAMAMQILVERREI
jgi:ferrous iron transport protein A